MADLDMPNSIPITIHVNKIDINSWLSIWYLSKKECIPYTVALIVLRA